VTVGYVAACYVVRCASAERYFLKLWPETRVGSQGAAQRDSSLRLTRALYDRGIYPNVPYPIPTRLGSLWASFAGSPFAVFPFLPGDVAPPWSQTPPAVRDELARAVATIHAATPVLADVLPARETFVLPWEADLRAGLGAIARIDGEGFGRFLEVYRNAGGVGPWHLDHFAFYLLRRYLGDMAVRLLRILHENPTEREDADLLDGMERWGFAQWRMLDQTLEEVAGALP
jgi:hypothetical protein